MTCAANFPPILKGFAWLCFRWVGRWTGVWVGGGEPPLLVVGKIVPLGKNDTNGLNEKLFANVYER